MTRDLASIGMNFSRWQDAVEAAIASNKLQVTGVVRGGQLLDFRDESGATMTLLASEPFTTFSGYAGVTTMDAHVTMVNDVLALCDVINAEGYHVATVTANLAQGPLLVDEPTQQWQSVNFSALAIDPHRAGAESAVDPTLRSFGADIVSSGSASTPDATTELTVELDTVTPVRNATTGDSFVHATSVAPFALDICLPAEFSDLNPGDRITGSFQLTARVIPPAGCGGGDGGCGCGSGGCGSH